MIQSNTLALTTLPNGFDRNGNLRLTVVLTPSISTDDGQPVALAGTPFDGWTQKIQKVTLSWSISFTPAAGIAVPTKLPATAIANKWNPDLWTAIFGGKRQARNRRGNTDLSNSWRLSHNISELHDRHRKLRSAHAQRALNAKIANLATDVGTIQNLRTIHKDFAEDFECLTPPVLYLFPTLNGGPSDASLQVDQRKSAIAARSNIDSAGITGDQKSTIQTRIDHALDILETQEGARLQAPALYCIYRHCVASVLPTGVTLAQASNSADMNYLPYLLYKAFTDAASPLVPKTCSASSDPVAAYENYVLMLLYHRGKPAPKQCTLATPDFHQLLGMVNHYPAMLRPLGLAFDLTIALPARFSDGVYVVEAANPFTDNTLLDSSRVTSYQTQCQLQRDKRLFCADPRDSGVIDQGYLALDAVASDAGSAYNLAQEDADGSALKFAEQAQNAARATEYSSAAPTSMTSVLAADNFRNDHDLIQPTPVSSANPIDAPPAARTVGISLFHEDRLATLETIVQNALPTSSAPGTPQTPKNPNAPLRAEDLVLGIRVDVKDGSRQWHSLCNRKSTYTVHYVDDLNASPVIWSPAFDREVELAADEGFVTFAATRSDLGDGTSQTQLHQSLFTWAGWSLSVPKPKGFKSVNEPQSPDNNCQSSSPLSISTRFELPVSPGNEGTDKERSEKLLPALRFNHDYKVRCRVVDLAGNSLPCIDADTPHVLALNPTFSRHEPIRAPQILLSEPIDREGSPGEQVDRLVARDGNEPTSRYLVPPRESLRLAELHNAVTKKRPLPESAFTGQNLMPDGSFPSVQDAYDQGWYIGEIDEDKKNNQDIIFLNRKGEFKAKNPYYPDPLAHYIRVKPFLVSDDPNLSRPLGSPFYIEIDPEDNWPNYLAAVVDLNGRPDHDTPSVDYNNDDRPPSIVVNLPPACTVVLVLSSAGYNIDAPKPHATDKTKAVALYQFHKSTVQSLGSPGTFKRQIRDFVGGSTHENRLQKRFAMLRNIRPTDKFQRTVMDILDDPNSYVDGDLPQMTPTRTLIFVHATRRPLAAPDFGSKGSVGDLRVVRAPGECKAALYGGVSAHWLSTSKVTCHAEWQDMVDDTKADAPGRASKPTEDVAFAITASDTERAAPDFDGNVYLRMLKSGIAHAFMDTRAHDVMYTLSAATRFRGYFPEPLKVPPRNPPAPPPDESSYSLPKPGEKNPSVRKITVLSSARPPVPSVAYIVPAFAWRDTYERKTRTWFSGRDVVLRVYLQRPFLVSGDHETVGVVIATPALSTDEKTQPLVSRWGSDPTRPITEPIRSSALTLENLCQTGDPPQTCQLAEGGVVDVKPCVIYYARDRKLWFSDIPVNTLGSYAPFIRLALVRWQPQALHADVDPTKPQLLAVDPNIDCRISPVVFADFIQLAPNRWVSVQRSNDSQYVITVSGVFPPPDQTAPGEPPLPTFTLSLYSRWYATGKDTGWRPVDFKAQFNYTPAPTGSADNGDIGNRISSWSTTLKLPHSAANRKYRILLQENEWYANSNQPRVVYSQFVDLP